jgi:Protein of unknown function (DUF1350)
MVAGGFAREQRAVRPAASASHFLLLLVTAGIVPFPLGRPTPGVAAFGLFQTPISSRQQQDVLRQIPDEKFASCLRLTYDDSLMGDESTATLRRKARRVDQREIEDESAFEEYEVTQSVDNVMWERFETSTGEVTHVIFPPSEAPVSASQSRQFIPLPTAILHFVGGTFFGSAPNIWYRRFLEELSLQNPNLVIVASSIPLVLPTIPDSAEEEDSVGQRRRRSRDTGTVSSTSKKNPLDHVSLAKRVRAQFQDTWINVVFDEYRARMYDQYDVEDEDSTAMETMLWQRLRTVPVCAIGHSLGARLFVVLATLMKQRNTQQPQQDARTNRRRRPAVEPPPSYQAMILISFTNYGAAVGIPGLSQLFRASLDVEQRSNLQSERSDKEDRQSRSFAENRRRRRPNTRQSDPRRRRRIYEDDYDEDWYDEDEDDDESGLDWGELWKDVQDSVWAQIGRVRVALTPSTRELEFTPTPEQLWRAIGPDVETGRRYQVPNTLVVQFDDDEVDQSAKLATVLRDTYQSEQVSEPATPETQTNSNETDQQPKDPQPGVPATLHFARLRGTHLTPVSVQDKEGSQVWLQQINSSIGTALWRVFRGRQKAPNNDAAFRELRQSVSRYISDIVSR